MARPDWSHLFAQLDAHRAADEKEARDVAFIRAFVALHPDDAHLRSQAEGHLTGSAFILDAARTRVLLLHHGKLGRWLQPGGHGEGEIDPREIALREVEEETGLARTTLLPCPDWRILDVDVHCIPARPGEPAHAHLDLRYGFVAGVGAAPRVSAESHALRWFPADCLPEGCDDSFRRAVRKLCNAAENA
ncbi:MAG TPA: NUDIX hydrolase [Myxococcales bacterium]|nr:NUDIX hydrolase [Myxococcales bacterium]